ncbi:MAG: cytochrome c [Syntrophobacteraceae bacterium]|nr:cytochrome c [Desulfobacteraceae bacterium]
MKSFILGMLTLFVVAVLASSAGIWLGVYNVAADVPHWEITRMTLEVARERSIAVRSGDLKLPSLDDPELVRAGVLEFHETCRVCHGAPGHPREEFARGMYPLPPSLSSGDVQDELKSEEVYWIVKNGLKMSGMPAFSAFDDERDILGAVAFVKRMKDMQPEEYGGLLEKSRGTRPEGP